MLHVVTCAELSDSFNIQAEPCLMVYDNRMLIWLTIASYGTDHHKPTTLINVIVDLLCKSMVLACDMNGRSVPFGVVMRLPDYSLHRL